MTMGATTRETPTETMKSAVCLPGASSPASFAKTGNGRAMKEAAARPEAASSQMMPPEVRGKYATSIAMPHRLAEIPSSRVRPTTSLNRPTATAPKPTPRSRKTRSPDVPPTEMPNTTPA